MGAADRREPLDAVFAAARRRPQTDRSRMQAEGAMPKLLLTLVPRLGLYVSGSGIVAMVVMIIAEIVSTKVFNYSLPYVLEYSEYLIAIIVFWGAAYALAQGAHVRADIVMHRCPAKWRRWIYLAGYVLGLIFLCLVFRQFLEVAWLSFKLNRYSFYPTPSSLWPPQAFAGLGLGLFILQLIIEIGRMGREILRGGHADRAAETGGEATSDPEGQNWIS